MKVISVLTILLLLVGSAKGYPKYAQNLNPNTLQVKVINATAQGRSVVGDLVFVDRYNEETLIDRIEGLVNEQGVAIFENIMIENLTSLKPSVEHDHVHFSGKQVAVKPGQTTLSAIVHLYDVSEDVSQLSSTPYHIIIKRGPQGLVVQEYLQLVNSSDHAIRSAETDSQKRHKTLTFSLPNGYKNFSSTSYLVPNVLVFNQDGFYDPMAIPPGSHKVIFGYTLDIKTDPVNFSKRMTVPTSNCLLFFALGDATVEGLGASQGELVLSDGVKSQYYKVDNMMAGETIRFKIHGLKTTSSPVWMPLTIVFGVISIVVIWRLRAPVKRVELT